MPTDRMELKQLLDFAVDIARDAGAITLFDRVMQIVKKSDRS
jgi:hypothetical protein